MLLSRLLVSIFFSSSCFYRVESSEYNILRLNSDAFESECTWMPERRTEIKIAGIMPEARVLHGKPMDFMFRSLKKCEMAICQRFLWAFKRYRKVKQYCNLTRRWLRLLLAATHVMERLAQPTSEDLLGILLAVLLRKGQILAPGVGTQPLGSGAERTDVVLVLAEIAHLGNTWQKLLEQHLIPFNWNLWFGCFFKKTPHINLLQ